MSDQITWECSICTKKVSKRQSSAMPDGTRACKHHPEALKAVAERIAQEERKKAGVVAAKQHQERSRRDQYANCTPEAMEEWRIHAETHCWVCDATGFKQRDYPRLMLLGMAVLEEKGIPINFLELPGQIFKELGIVGASVLIELDVTGASIRYCKPTYRNIADLAGCATICRSCVEKLGLGHRMPEIKLPNPTIETLHAVSAVMQTSGMNEELHRAAASLIAMKNAGSPKNIV